MNEWIFSPGYPLVTLLADSPSTLKLTQHRFTYAEDASTTSPGASAQRWHIPIQLRVTTTQGVETHRVLLSDQETRIILPKDWTSVLANEDGHGFYRVRYSPDLLARLQQTGLHTLAPVERFNLLNDTWASTIAGMVPPADYVALTKHFRDENDPHVWAVCWDHFPR